MVFYRIQPGLFLADHSPSLRRGTVPFLGPLGQLQLQIQILTGIKHALKLFLISLYIAFLSQGILHIPGSGLGSLLVISISNEGLPHSPNIIQNPGGLCRLRYKKPHLWIVSQASGTVNIKFSVWPRYKAQIPEGGVRNIFRAVGKADLQFSGQLRPFNKGHQILAGCLCIWQNIEILALLHTGKGGNHHISGEIPSSSSGDNAMV